MGKHFNKTQEAWIARTYQENAGHLFTTNEILRIMMRAIKHDMEDVNSSMIMLESVDDLSNMVERFIVRKLRRNSKQ